MNKTNCKRFLLSLLTATLFLGGGVAMMQRHRL